MLGRDNVISASAALRLVINGIPEKTLRETRTAIGDALGLICSRDIFSAEALPPFARSTVDGYAVRAADTFGATETMPAYLDLSKEIFMGEEPDITLEKARACAIPTGGMLPSAADAVVMFEHVQRVDEKMIEVLKPVVPGENVVQPGEDVRAGDLLIHKGRRIRPQDIGACAGLGITEIAVYERLRVSIISTGDEIVPADEIPGNGRVRDINSYVIAGMITEAGHAPLRKGIFKDEYDGIRSAIGSAVTDSDLIVVSGGTSVGTKDMIAKIINDLGSPGVLFHGVSLKPGKPLIGGIIHGVPIFGLPGHPAAVSVCCEIFILPVLNALSGLIEKIPAHQRGIVKARLARNVSSVQGREEHIRATLEERPDGVWAVPVLGKSGLITTLVKADGTFVIPVNINGIEKGEYVDVRLF